MYGFRSTFENVDFAYNIQMRVSADYAHMSRAYRNGGRVWLADYYAAIADRAYANARDLKALKRDILTVWERENAADKARRAGER